MHVFFLLLVSAGAAVATKTTKPPTVYWVSNPTLAGETFLVAGAGLAGAKASLSGGATATATATPSTTWNMSMKLVLPKGCGPPCLLRVTGADGAVAQTVAVNAPDLWWASSSAPAGSQSSLKSHAYGGSGSGTAVALLATGQLLRVFGRSLGWRGGACVSAGTFPAPLSTTVLRLLPQGQGANSVGAVGITVGAVSANCYEAAFKLSGAHPGKYLCPGCPVFGVVKAPLKNTINS